MGCSDGRLALWDVADLCATQQLVEVGAGLAPEPLSSASPIWHAAIPSETQRPCSVAVHQDDLLLAVGCWDGACCLYHKTAEGQWNATCQLLLPEDRMMLFDHTQPGAWVQWRPSSSSQLLVASSVPPQVFSALCTALCTALCFSYFCCYSRSNHDLNIVAPAHTAAQHIRPPQPLMH